MQTLKLARAALGAVALAGGLLATAPASASVTYNGGTFDVQVISGSGTTWNIDFVANFSGWTTPALTTIDVISFKVSQASVTTLGAVSAPSGTWTTSLNGLNNNGCTGGVSGGECADYASGTPVSTTGTKTWHFTNVVFDQVVTAAMFTDATNPIRANFGPGNGNIMSLNGGFTLVCTTDCTPQRRLPEPGSLALIGLAVLGLAGARRRRIG